MKRLLQTDFRLMRQQLIGFAPYQNTTFPAGLAAYSEICEKCYRVMAASP